MKTSLRHIIIELSKIQDSILRAAKEICHIQTLAPSSREPPYKAISRFLSSKSADQENGMIHSNCWKEKKKNRILYPAQLSFRHAGEIITFLDKQKTYLIRNAKGSLSSWKERLLTNSMKSYESVKLTGKSSIVKFRMH